MGELWRAGLAGIAILLAAASSARADLILCNRMSFVVEAAIGVEDKGATATRGWFHLVPGQCRVVLQGAVQADQLYLHARALPAYGTSPEPQSEHADLCVASGDFVIPAARGCRAGQRLARFTAIKPSETPEGLLATLAEEAEYSDEQARRAGIQRLLVMAGYDATPIDGVSGRKTDAAIAQFIKDRGLPADAANAANFFDVLLQAVQQPAASGLSWCNDTQYAVLAAYGIEERSGVTTRGWYRIEPGKCLRPDVLGKPRRLYSYGEAVDASGQGVRRGGRRLAWGGNTTLCTRDVKFELSEHKDCAAAGLAPTGFAIVDLSGRPSVTIRFQE